MSVFKTKVKDIGAEAALFADEKMIILFGEEAPEGLAEYCYNIQVNELETEIAKGMTLFIDQLPFTITAVGDVVNKNLSTLGHITIKFDGSTEPELPGTLYVEEKEIPLIAVESIVEIK